MSTKKLKSTARFGARYGTKIKTRVLEIEKKQKQPFNCPKCGFPKVKRKSRGIFRCRKCGAVFAGGAYVPETLTGSIIKKMVSQKTFVPALKELIEATEKTKHGLEEIPAEARQEKTAEKRQRHDSGSKGKESVV
ncbi:MAG: 50S ribosomal protein L37ae [Candidatus Diapherotrites archaeon]|uniref:Large ribosomal subunit protein eL43 n=1 Tax=Candidatus Iainarchaeum sp. TaxID=3101447 RepID=A0A8T4KT65_9ARCH|nr:50S ribosomal protein L37ae [Candidatus Diapherotrites archaeon]